MAMSSAEIAGSIGQFQQFHAGSQAYSGMIGGMFGQQGNPQQQAQGMAGGLMSRAGALGAPLASLGLGLAGLDPLSMGMRAGSFASGTLGLGMGAAGAAGLGVAGGVAAIGAGAAFGAHQMFTGAQQQQQFNQQMKQSYNFISPAGRGFSAGQTGVMSQQLRGMSGEMGSGGEMASFQELTSLASNMGRMGMAQGVRDVQQFGQKFREMVTTLKTVAQEMGTSLQSAQEFVSGMRSSGVFRAADQLKASGAMRAGAASGTIAVSELSAMGNIGAQISRSVGGRGRSGMFAGVNTMSQVGASIDSGSINEEDIYNATGLTGAEGRQAYATSQLSHSAKFLKGGKGRWFLGSVAGENGQLDQESVAAVMGGDMTVGATKSAAHRNLGKVGRANFIRNEGRLRGAAMEQFGGLLPAIQMAQWAAGAGVDINSMGDREMLFASRQMGVGMDELEGMVKQARDLPNAMKQMRQTQDMDQYNTKQSKLRKTQGLEGVKRSFEHAREKVQGAVQQVGADLYTDLTNYIESSINKMSGATSEEATRGILQAYDNAKMGNKEQFNNLMGKGNVRSGFGGGKGAGGSAYEAFKSSGSPLGGTSDRDRMNKAGYGSLFSGIDDISTTRGKGRYLRSASDESKEAGLRDAALQTAMQSARAIEKGAGAPIVNTNTSILGGAMRSEFDQAYGPDGKAGGTMGKDRIDVMKSMLSDRVKSGDPKVAAAAAETLKEMARNEAQGAVGHGFNASIVAGIEAQGAVADGARIGQNSTIGELFSGAGSRRFATRTDQAKALGAAMSVGSEKKISHGAIGAALGPMGYLIGAVGDILLKRKPASDEALGEGMLTPKMLGLAGQVMGTDSKAQEDARSQISRTLQDLTARKKQGEGGLEVDMTNLRSLQKMDMAATEIQAAERRNGKPLSEKEMSAIAAKHGTTREAMSAMAQGVQDQKDVNVMALGRMVSGKARATLEGASGVYTAGKDGKAGTISASILSSLSPAGQKSLQARLGQAAAEARMGDVGISVDATRAAGDEAVGYAQKAQDEMLNMTVADRRKAAAVLRREGSFGLASEFSESAAAQTRLQNASRRGGAGLASVMGFDLTQDEKRTAAGFRGRTQKEQTSMANMIKDKLGLGTGDTDTADAAVAKAQRDVDQGGGDPVAAKARLAAAVTAREEAGTNKTLRAEIDAVSRAKPGSASQLKALATLESDPKYQEMKQKEKDKKDADSPTGKGFKSVSDAVDKASTAIVTAVNGIKLETPGPGGAAVPPVPPG